MHYSGKLTLTAFALSAALSQSIAQAEPSLRLSYVLSVVTPVINSGEPSKPTPWENQGAPYDCTNWSPSTSSVGRGVTFIQTATDCKQEQTQTVGGKQYKQIIAASSTRESVGILEQWNLISPVFTDWGSTQALYGCNAWSPSPATVNKSLSFIQESSSCKTDQERTRQEREQESYSMSIRNSGEPVVERQTLQNQSATRNYTVELGEWANNGFPTQCTDWSPAPDTILTRTTFTQNATDCTQSQSRSRKESYTDNVTGQKNVLAQTVEQQTLKGVKGSQQATGTGGLNYYPLSSAPGVSTHNGISNGATSSSGTVGYQMWGPYVHPFKGGSYNLKIYGTTSNAQKSTYDIVLDGNVNFVIPPTPLTANGSGILIDRQISIPSIAASDFGMEIRVLTNNASDSVQITGYTLTPL